MSAAPATVWAMAGTWWGVITTASVPALATAILDAQRQRPIIVVTTAGYFSPEHIPQATRDEADELRRAVGDLADIAIVATGDVSFALEALLPDRWHIFNGFCRSYPAGIVDNPDIRRSPLRRRKAQEVASEQVISDALAQANAAGLLAARAGGSIAVTGTVTGFLANGEQALVDAGRQLPAVCWRDTASPGIPFDWLVSVGDRVPGVLDIEHNRFLLTKPAFGPAELVAQIPHGTVTLALVEAVTPETAVLRVHPDLAITVHRSDVSSNPLDMLDLFFVDGEVVRVRVIHLSTGRPHLRLSDIDEDEPVLPAVQVIEGGGPWLVEGRALPSLQVSEPDIVPDSVAAEPREATQAADTGAVPALPAVERPKPGMGVRATTPAAGVPLAATPDAGGDAKGVVNSMSLKITALTSDNARLQKEAATADRLRQELQLNTRRLRDVTAELGEAYASIAGFKDRHKKAVEELRRARRAQQADTAQRGPRDRRGDWPDDESWLRHEVVLAWIDRLPASEKQRFPLPPDYLFGPRFAESLRPLDSGQFDKAMKCVVDVLTDRAKDLPGRELHRLRTGDGGGDAPRERSHDGAVAWRAAIEVNAPSARRLHFWRIGTRIELAQVGVHDDMEA